MRCIYGRKSLSYFLTWVPQFLGVFVVELFQTEDGKSPDHDMSVELADDVATYTFAISVADKVAKGELNSAFAIVTPPGHHAEKKEPVKQHGSIDLFFILLRTVYKACPRPSTLVPGWRGVVTELVFYTHMWHF